MEYFHGASGSFGLNVSCPDDFGPFLGFLGNELSKIGGRADKRCASEISQPRLDFGVGEARVDLLVELVDDLGWRGLGCADAEPIACLVPWQELPHARDVRQGLRARLGRHRERAQPTSPDIFDWRDNGDEHDLHLTGDEIGCADFTTISVAILVPAPARFSTTKGWPRRSESCWPITRATTSVVPP